MIDFLGYAPNPQPTSIPELLVAIQRRLGWNGYALAEANDVSEDILKKWRNESAYLTSFALKKLEALLQSDAILEDLKKVASDKHLVEKRSLQQETKQDAIPCGCAAANLEISS